MQDIKFWLELVLITYATRNVEMQISNSIRHINLVLICLFTQTVVCT